jgi:CRAL/TRIO domain
LTLGIWAIIKNWLDPVVASKIHFTRSSADLEKFIPRGRIVKELEGDEQFEWKYIEPVPGENDIMKDTATRDKIQAERDEMVRRFEESTRKWIAGEEGAGKERDEIAKELNLNYWKLDPYVRARTVYDRAGAIGSRGGFVYSKSETTGASNPKPVAEEQTVETST